MQHSFFTRIRGFYSSATAFTRQGAITLARSIARPIHSTPAQKTFALIGGAIAIGAGVASFLAADFGLPPYDVLLNAISDHSGLSHGQSGWFVAVVLGALAAVLGRRPDLWTLAWVVIVGFAVDGAIHVLHTPDSLVSRIMLVPVGTGFIALGVALVVFSGLTGGVFEMLMHAAEDRGASGTRVRTVLELGAFALGAVGGGVFGPATFVFALCIGPAISVLAQGLVDHRSGREARLKSVLQ
jgi:uncharacterized membrane protein YczE